MARGSIGTTLAVSIVALVLSAAGPMTHPRTEHAAVLLRDGRVLLIGSHTHGDADFTAELFQVRASSTA